MKQEPLTIEQATVAGWQGVPKRALLEDTPLRRELLFEHPALRRLTQIATPMVKEMYRSLKAAILLGQAGIYIAGDPMSGRSCALRVCMKLLEAEYPRLLTYYHCTSASTNLRPKVAWQDMLSSAGHLLLSGDLIPLRERLVAKVADDLRRRGTGYTAIWCVDDAHELQERELEVLSDLQSRLWSNGVILLTVMVADRQQSSARSSGDLARYRPLLSRFFRKSIELRGVSSISDVEAILDAFDTSEFPEGSEVRWSEFFVPRAYASGFRLAGQATNAFEALSRCFPSASQQKPSLDAVFSAIRWTLLRSTRFDAPDFNLLPEDWSKAVQCAALDETYTPPRLPLR